jgi:NAD(P)-dependent dehydrogenase (short-subunit alcohol dehydrogenase family)
MNRTSQGISGGIAASSISAGVPKRTAITGPRLVFGLKCIGCLSRISAFRFYRKEIALDATPSPAQRWALILGASSGFGAAASIALARHGFHIIGVHLDRRATLPNAEKVVAQVRASGCKALFFNVNASDPERRCEVVRAARQAVEETPGSSGINSLLHSLAFGTLKPYIAATVEGAIKPADMNMTLDVMAHSLVYWVQDLFAAGLLPRGARIFAMTSAGGHRVWQSYGAVSAAKAALESHIRQLAVELAPYGISANALRAGVTETPAARKIPGSERMFDRALQGNPGKRLTTPEDVAEVLVSLSLCRSPWMTGNVVGVDGGEDLTG